jgi:hypothetical protein
MMLPHLEKYTTRVKLIPIIHPTESNRSSHIAWPLFHPALTQWHVFRFYASTVLFSLYFSQFVVLET